MVDSLVVSGHTKKEKYESLIPQIKALMEGEKDSIANLSNILAALKYSMDYFWIGIYFVKPKGPEAVVKTGTKDTQLVLGLFQGPVACTRIDFGKGVCGKCWELKKTIIVEDVENFPGHIACSALTKSEIVLPAFCKDGNVLFVLDVDSVNLADFDETDQSYLEKIIQIILESIDMEVFSK
ncbi:MAG: GAF domain-containing protein [Bacteroidota bacterium]